MSPFTRALIGLRECIQVRGFSWYILDYIRQDTRGL